MAKQLKSTLVITVILCLLPIVAGFLLWDQLPDQIATHFGMNNEANGWMPKPVAIVFPPVLLAVIEFVCVLSSIKKADTAKTDKFLLIVMWMMPVLSWVLMSISFGYSMGEKPNVGAIVIALLGILFAALGKFLPDTKPNRFVGMRFSWTLNNEENWRRSNSFAGKCMMIGGICMVIDALAMFVLPGNLICGWAAGIIIVIAVLVPTVYTFKLRKQ